MEDVTDTLSQIPRRLWESQQLLGEARIEDGKWMAKDVNGKWRQVWVVNTPASYEQPLQNNGS